MSYKDKGDLWYSRKCRGLYRAFLDTDHISPKSLELVIPEDQYVFGHNMTGNNVELCNFIEKWLDYGASVRASQYLILGSKARALMNGRYHVSYDDIRALAPPVFRHRILTNFHAESERISTDKIIEQLLDAVPVPKSMM